MYVLYMRVYLVSVCVKAIDKWSFIQLMEYTRKV